MAGSVRCDLAQDRAKVLRYAVQLDEAAEKAREMNPADFEVVEALLRQQFALIERVKERIQQLSEKWWNVEGAGDFHDILYVVDKEMDQGLATHDLFFRTYELLSDELEERWKPVDRVLALWRKKHNPAYLPKLKESVRSVKDHCYRVYDFCALQWNSRMWVNPATNNRLAAEALLAMLEGERGILDILDTCIVGHRRPTDLQIDQMKKAIASWPQEKREAFFSAKVRFKKSHSLRKALITATNTTVVADPRVQKLFADTDEFYLQVWRLAASPDGSTFSKAWTQQELPYLLPIVELLIEITGSAKIDRLIDAVESWQYSLEYRLKGAPAPSEEEIKACISEQKGIDLQQRLYRAVYRVADEMTKTEAMRSWGKENYLLDSKRLNTAISQLLKSKEQTEKPPKKPLKRVYPEDLRQRLQECRDELDFYSHAPTIHVEKAQQLFRKYAQTIREIEILRNQYLASGTPLEKHADLFAQLEAYEKRKEGYAAVTSNRREFSFDGRIWKLFEATAEALVAKIEPLKGPAWQQLTAWRKTHDPEVKKRARELLTPIVELYRNLEDFIRDCREEPLNPPQMQYFVLALQELENSKETRMISALDDCLATGIPLTPEQVAAFDVEIAAWPAVKREIFFKGISNPWQSPELARKALVEATMAEIEADPRVTEVLSERPGEILAYMYQQFYEFPETRHYDKETWFANAPYIKHLIGPAAAVVRENRENQSSNDLEDIQRKLKRLTSVSVDDFKYVLPEALHELYLSVYQAATPQEQAQAEQEWGQQRYAKDPVRLLRAFENLQEDILVNGLE